VIPRQLYRDPYAPQERREEGERERKRERERKKGRENMFVHYLVCFDFPNSQKIVFPRLVELKTLTLSI